MLLIVLYNSVYYSYMYYAMVGWFRDQGKKVHCAPIVSVYLAPKIVLFGHYFLHLLMLACLHSG